MTTLILEEKERNDLYQALANKLFDSPDVVLVNISTFYDPISEHHKAVLCYYL